MHLCFQNLFTALVLITAGSLFTAYGALELFIFIKKPSKQNLIEFRDNLPVLLQQLYFNENTFENYKGGIRRVTLETMLELSQTFPFNIFIIWGLGTILPNFVFIRTYVNLYQNPIIDKTTLIFSGLFVILTLAVHVRAFFFGYKLKGKAASETID